MGDYIELDKLARVVIVGVLLGAGLPAIFALGVQALAGPGATTDGGRRKVSRVIVAALAFGTVTAGVITAVVIMAVTGR